MKNWKLQKHLISIVSSCFFVLIAFGSSDSSTTSKSKSKSKSNSSYDTYESEERSCRTCGFPESNPYITLSYGGGKYCSRDCYELGRGR
jgi:hypothetical protein|tara:strand:- start:830 stop:1096 length:267 start_codon:yes stop_codon:yes gene_type:complete